jgi:hypothetical protein
VQSCVDGTDIKMLRSGMDSDTRAARDTRIYARRVEGLTLAAIGREFGLCRKTIRLIARRMDRHTKWHAAKAQNHTSDYV